jgi:signal transduction histidine kinase
MTGSSVDVYNPKTVRASAGSIFHVPVVRGIGTREALEALRERGFGIVAMDAHGGADLFEAPLPGATAFVFGNEAHGLPEDLARSSDLHVRVPHAGRAESLNLAAAATVCLFERVRRGGTEGAPDGTTGAGISRGTETLESLVAAAAHDIRSPLTAMKGFGYALEKRWVDMTDEQRDLMLTGILYDADRMDTIVRQLVDAARVLSGRFEPFPEMTDVGGLVRQVSDQLARDPEHPPIRWRGEARPTLLDAGRLRTTIVAFAEALAWWAGEGDIEIDASLDGSLHLTASRASPPIDAAAIEDLFEARAPGSGGGSKIGLYVARRVAEAQGGRTWGEHVDGRLAFHVELPAGGAATGTP